MMPPPPPRQPTSLKEVDEMAKRLEEIRRSICAAGGSSRPITGGSPFVPEILSEVLPKGARLPHLESYDGSTDPEEHVYYFLNTM